MKITSLEVAQKTAAERALRTNRTHVVVEYRTDAAVRFRVFPKPGGIQARNAAKIGETFFKVGEWDINLSRWFPS